MSSDKGWSAPTAIGIAGLGGGFEIGLEVGFCLNLIYLTIHSLFKPGPKREPGHKPEIPCINKSNDTFILFSDHFVQVLQYRVWVWDHKHIP